MLRINLKFPKIIICRYKHLNKRILIKGLHDINKIR